MVDTTRIASIDRRSLCVANTPENEANALGGRRRAGPRASDARGTGEWSGNGLEGARNKQKQTAPRMYKNSPPSPRPALCFLLPTTPSPLHDPPPLSNETCLNPKPSVLTWAPPTRESTLDASLRVENLIPLLGVLVSGKTIALRSSQTTRVTARRPRMSPSPTTSG